VIWPAPAENFHPVVRLSRTKHWFRQREEFARRRAQPALHGFAEEDVFLLGFGAEGHGAANALAHRLRIRAVK